MAYTPGVVAGGSGDKGLAKVIVNSKDTNLIMVKLRAQTWNKTDKKYDYENKEFKLLRSDCSEELQKIIHPTSNALVQMSAKGDKIYKFIPWEGMFVGKFREFVAEKGKEPAPKTNTDWNYQYFIALIGITKGPFVGTKVPYVLRYHFAELEENGELVVAYSHPKSKYTAVLGEFFDVTGAWARGPMKYKDNVLPAFQKRMIASDREFKFVMKEGNISTIFSGETPETEDVPEDTE